MVCRDPNIPSSSAAFSSKLAGSWARNRVAGTQTNCSDVDCEYSRHQLSVLCHNILLTAISFVTDFFLAYIHQHGNFPFLRKLYLLLSQPGLCRKHRCHFKFQFKLPFCLPQHPSSLAKQSCCKSMECPLLS